MSLSHRVKTLCQTALLQAFPALSPEMIAGVEITKATQEQFGHYQCNSAMKLAKILQQNPRQMAEQWVTALNALPDINTVFSKIDIAGPGFINFSFDTAFVAKTLQTQLNDPRLGVTPLKKPLNVVIDFSSPNVAKEMHVGHLRSTIIGDCLAKILAFMGHTVLRLNHIGDWGTQFGMLIAYLETVVPDITNDAPPQIDLAALSGFYQAAKKEFDMNPAFKKIAQEKVVALQGGDLKTQKAWQHICAISREAYQAIYDLLDVELIERGESFYNHRLPFMLKTLEEKGLITVSDGAKCLYLDGFLNREGEPLPLIIQKSDGGYNYATTDITALEQRVSEEKGDWLIYVTDKGQSLHFQMIFEAAKVAGFFDPNTVRVDHVPFGLVLKPDGKKFKTREGKTERLIDLLDTAIYQAKEKLKEHNPDITETELAGSAKILGINAIKYADLSCNRIHDYIFSYDKMLKFEGNTAAFLLYAYVRIQSILRKLNTDTKALLADKTTLVLQDPAEIALALLVCQFNEVLEDTARELLPSRLTDYLYRLAEKFHGFFHQCRVEGAKNEKDRLRLCIGTAQILHQGLLLLGLKPLNRM